MHFSRISFTYPRLDVLSSLSKDSYKLYKSTYEKDISFWLVVLLWLKNEIFDRDNLYIYICKCVCVIQIILIYSHLIYVP